MANEIRVEKYMCITKRKDRQDNTISGWCDHLKFQKRTEQNIFDKNSEGEALKTNIKNYSSNI